jgi:RND family efflux transporter MFP subunit
MRRLPLLLVIALLTGCASAVGPSEEGPRDRPPAPVEVVKAAAPSLDRSFSVLGEVRTRHHAELALGADGTVLMLNALEGERVPAGRTLVRIDDAVARAEHAAAEAVVVEIRVELQRAEADLSRYERIDEKLLAGSELDRVRADVGRLHARLVSQEARVDLALAVLRRHTIVAPFDGIVTRRHVDPGDWVVPGRVLLELASTTSLDVLVDVDAAIAGRLREGDAVRIRGDGAYAPGSVAAVVPVLDPTTRTARVRISPSAEAAAGLLPGAAVTVLFDVNTTLAEGAMVPRDAVLTGPRGTRVFRVIDGKAVPTPVTIRAEAPTEMLVSGVEEGELVVTRGNERLRPDQAVRILGDEKTR